MNKQKGSSGVLIIILVLLILVGISYFFLKKDKTIESDEMNRIEESLVMDENKEQAEEIVEQLDEGSEADETEEAQVNNTGNPEQSTDTRCPGSDTRIFHNGNLQCFSQGDVDEVIAVEQSDISTIEFTNIGYKLDFPSSWILADTSYSSRGTFTVELDLDGEITPGFSEASFLQLDSSGKNVTDEINEMKIAIGLPENADYLNILEDIGLKPLEEIKIDGLNAYVTESYLAEGDEEDYEKNVNIQIKEGVILRLNYEDFIGNGTNQDKFNSLVESFSKI